MMKILLFFCFAGLAFGFQPMLKYKYHYEGVSDTGIPDISTDGAAAGIKLDAILEITEGGHAVIQFENFKLGEYHGCLGCDRKHSIPDDHFKAIQDDHLREMIEKPFEANLFGMEDYSMMVDTEEILWVKNVRRAIVGTFRNYILSTNFNSCQCPITKYIKAKQIIPNVFTRMEETILGKCEVQYTAHKVHGYQGEQLNAFVESHVMEEDVQRDHAKFAELKKSKKKTSKKYSSKSIKFSKASSKYSRKQSVPHLEDDLYHVTRTLNFDHCEHNVALRHSSGHFDFKTGASSYGWLGGRSSVSEYILRGTPGAFRMEQAVIEGAVSVNALGIAAETLTTRTNQTLHLISVEECTKPTKISPSVPIKGWMQEILSPYQVPKLSTEVPWITYTGQETMVDRIEMVTGIKQTAEETSARKDILIQCLKAAAKALSAEKPSDEVAPDVVMQYLKDSKLILETLPEHTIEQILDEIIVEDNIRPNEIYEQKLLIDTLVASGTKRATHFVLNLIKNKKISDFQGLLISATTMQTLFDVTVIPDIADFVKEISMRSEPFVASTVLINFANMVHHYCVHPTASTQHYAGALFGDEGCNTDYLKKNFLPYIVDMMHDETKTWERIVAIKVFQKLGISQTVNILGPVALGQKGPSEQVRLAAIYGLSRWNLPWSTREHTMQILSEIYTNVGEIPRLRVAALAVYSYWGPNASFFHRLARLSWREPSMAVAAFYKHLIHAFSVPSHPLFVKQQQAAIHAIRLVRPVSPSMEYPLIFKEYKAILNGQMEKIEEGGIFSYPYPEPFINFDAFSFLQNSFNGLHMTMSEMMMSSGGIGDFVKNTFAKYENDGIHSKVVEDLYSKIQDVIQAEPTRHREPLLTMQFRIFENLHILFPITKDTIGASQFTDTVYLGSLILELQTGLSRSLGKFFTVASYKEVVPNEMGLPIYTGNGGFITFADVFNARLSVSSNSITEIPKKAHLFIEEYLKLMSESCGEMSIIVPWSNSKLTSCVRSTRGVSRPVMTTIDVDASSDVKQPKVKLSFEPAFDTKSTLIQAKTVPMTRIESLSFTGQTRKSSVKILLKHDNIKKVIPLPQTYTGLDYTLKWNAQFRYPFDLFGLKNYFKDQSKVESSSPIVFLLSSPTAQFWSLEMELDPQKSDTNNITIEFKLQLAAPHKKMDDISQVSQTSGHMDYEQEEFMDFEQEQHNFGDHEFQSVNLNEVEDHGGVTINDNFQEKAEKMTKYYGEKANSVDVTLGYYGTNSRKYELFYTWSKPHYSNFRKKVKSQLTLLRSAIPGVDNKGHSICMDKQKVTPVISEIDKLELILDRNLDVEITRTITPECEGKPILIAETVAKMSPKYIEKLKREIPKDCNYDSFDPLHSFYSALYDDIHTTIKWEDVCKIKRVPILTHAINTVDKMFLNGYHAFDCDNQHTTKLVDLNLHRCMDTDQWFFKLVRDDHTFEIDAIPSNDFLNFFLSIRAVSANRIDQFKDYYSPSDKCVIKHDKVRTFDGVVYDYEPTQCWTVAVKDCKADRFMVLVRASTTESTIPEVRIIDRENSLVINDIKGETPDKDGKTEYYSKKTGKLVVKIYHHEDNYAVSLINRAKIFITDRVEINALTKDVCGICGTKDYEKLMEYTGPKHCQYMNPQQFVTAWTAGGETCNLYDIHEKRVEIEDYQKTCLPIYDLYKIERTYQHLHTEYRYVTKQIGDKHCVSYMSYPHCANGFVSIHSKTIHVDFHCWHKDSAPSEITSSLESGVNHIFNHISYRPLSSEISLMQIDAKCVEYVN